MKDPIGSPFLGRSYCKTIVIDASDVKALKKAEQEIAEFEAEIGLVQARVELQTLFKQRGRFTVNSGRKFEDACSKIVQDVILPELSYVTEDNGQQALQEASTRDVRTNSTHNTPNFHCTKGWRVEGQCSADGGDGIMKWYSNTPTTSPQQLRIGDVPTTHEVTRKTMHTSANRRPWHSAATKVADDVHGKRTSTLSIDDSMPR
ncbi:hypothetical protein CBR_g29840 [Chara braunii]|uniref:Uncharacterized protein n=1 Tax=Chara braunii TaxID=69332 RepID=A0A388JWX5_CHABU|nr:hypothetical protein CBR_g29840 [Chara braunii]|eukprot:GBG62232.1 hypothetical protein CBR_g29840 [Chara braunii]